MGTVFAISLLCSLGFASSQLVLLTPNRKEVAAFANSSYIVACRADGASTITWSRPGGEVISETSGRMHVEEGQASSLELIFESIRKKDKGDYICTADYEGEPQSQSFSLSVLKPIIFTDAPELQLAPEGSDFLVKCEVGSEPEPNVSWRIKGKSFRKSSKYEIRRDGLLIRNITLEDDGLYLCKASMYTAQLTDFKEQKIVVRVQHKPKWSPGHEEQFYGFVGGVTNMSCGARAEPGAEFTWIKEGIVLQPSEYYQMFNSDHVSTLQISIKNESVFGDYECKATNAYGTLERVVVLEMVSKPQPPSFKVKAIRSTHIVLEIYDYEMVADQSLDRSLPLSLEVTGHKIQFKTKGQDWVTSQEMTVEKDSRPLSISGLQFDTEYDIRISAKSAAGYGDFSEAKKARTMREATTIPPMPMAGSSAAVFASITTMLISSMLYI